MATTYAAMKGKFGSTEYFILAMKAGELVSKTRIPSEMPEWKDLTLEEREQRQINHNRVKAEIAPYLVNDKDRFFGAIILTAVNFSSSDFEPLLDVSAKGVPNRYKTESESMGFLTLGGGEYLTPLDGQHRLEAIKFALEGRDNKGKEIKGLTPFLELADEDVAVIIIPYDKKKSRRMFTHVNKYARPTTPGQNLITDDDDIIAVLSRKIANDPVIGMRLVSATGNNLGPKSKQFTTLMTLAECNVEILDAHFPGEIDRKSPVTDKNKKSLYTQKVDAVWKFLVKKVDLFSDALHDKSESGDETRIGIRKEYLLGKPAAQWCLVKVFVYLTTEGKLTADAAVKKLNAVDWLTNSPIWDRLFMAGEKIIPKNKGLVADIMCYQADKKSDDGRKQELLQKYLLLFPHDEQKGKQLPALIK